MKRIWRSRHRRPSLSLALPSSGWCLPSKRFSVWLCCVLLSLSTILALHSPLFAQSLPTLERGQHAYQAGQYAEAVQTLQAVLDDYTQRGDRVSQAQTLNFLAQSYHQLGDYTAAENAIAQSLQLLSALPNQQPLHAQALTVQAQLYASRGQWQAAQTTFAQAEAMYAERQDDEGVQGSQLNRAQVLMTLGNYRTACDGLLQEFAELPDCEALMTLTPQDFQEWLQQITLSNPTTAKMFSGLATSFLYTGSLNRSRQMLEKVLAKFEEWQQPDAIAITHFALGNVVKNIQPMAAIEHYESAIALLETFPLSLTRTEARINALGLQLALKKQDSQTFDDATKRSGFERKSIFLPQSNQQENVLPTQSELNQEINTIQLELNAIAPSHRQLLAQAQFTRQLISAADMIKFPTSSSAQSLSKIIQVAQELGDHLVESYALGLLGTLYEHNHQYVDAQTVTDRALIIAQVQQIPELVYQWEWQQARLLEKQGDLPGAIAANQRAVKSLEILEYDLVSSNRDSQFSFQDQVEPIYRNLITLLIEAIDVSSPQQKQAHLQQAMAVMENLQVAELNDFFRSACISTQDIDLEVQQNAALLYPIILRDRLVTILSLPGRDLQMSQTDVDANEVELIARRLMRLLTSQRSEAAILEPAQQLYDWLIRPFAKELAQSEIETLVFVPDGYLRRIPPAVLHDGQHYLVEEYSIAITPGLRLLASQRLDQVKINPFVAGLSDARPGFQAIPAVQEEVTTISADFLGSKTLLNESFTQETLLEILQNESFPIVHLATHGVFGETPEETFLLAWDNRIKATDLAIALKSRELQTQVPIELLVLSACQTALGDNRAGLGLAGLAVRSGARSTIASLWSVSDASTSQLMRNLYGRLRQFHAENQNVNRAQVLQQAQLSLLHTEDYQHPYFWGAFILIGNWQ